MDNKNFAIGTLSVTAVVLLMALIILALNWWLPYQQHKQYLKKLRRQHRQDTKRNDSRA